MHELHITEICHFLSNVALIMVQLQSESSVPPATENLTVFNSQSEIKEGKNLPFIVKKLNISSFEEGDVVVLLPKPPKENRKRRATVDGDVSLEPGGVYRTAQRNEDMSGVSFFIISINDYT